MATSPRPFGVQFSEAITYLKAKLPEASLAWDDLAGPVHAKVFTVAGATSADLARDLQSALVKALEQGATITAFRKDFDAAVQKFGWSYKGKRGWRTSIIFNTNMRSAHMAGRWQQIQANKAARPYLQYRTAGDARVRPQHRAWNGLIYPVDDAFWSTHYPPNGWGCRCTVRSYSMGDMQGRGLRVSEPFPMRTRQVVNAAGDVVDRVPIGIDPGWDHNVGKSWISPELALGQKLASLPRDLQGTVVDKTISPAYQKAIETNWKGFQNSIKATGKPSGDSQILGFLDSATLDGLAAKAPNLVVDSTAVAAFDNRTNHLTGAHKTGGNPAQVWPQDMVDELPALLRDYQAVLWDAVGEVLVVVPSGVMPGGAGRVGKIVLRPNIKTKFGTALSVVSLGTVERHNLMEPRYSVLVGRLTAAK
jgi:SPP1 gp7 family putative phage head morphogenesis protein